MTGMIDITNDNFRAEVLDSDLPVLVDCWATWCGPCKLLAPELDALAEDQAGRLKVVKLDVDQYQSLSQMLGVSMMPTMVLFAGGALGVSILGFRTKDYILEQIEPFLKKIPADG